MLKALLFDFDGLILDTETPDYLVWKNIYQENGFDFPHADWGRIIGGNGLTDFDAAGHLSRLSQGRLDSVSLRARHSVESLAMLDSQPIMPGVMELIHDAKRHNLKLAIASSSEHAWVDNHAKRLGIFHLFDAVVAADDVGAGRTKPNPDLFLTALNQLQVQRNEAVVFEDSPNGVTAANRAGIFVVAVPNQVTSLLSHDGADVVVKSLADLPLDKLIELLPRFP
ncbi:MAG: HAD family phosphatase [Anaerolineales bacterium]|nr:HAD family phosphatase [Anaerolineales bacterium]